MPYIRSSGSKDDSADQNNRLARSVIALVIPVFDDRASCAQLLRAIASVPGARDWHICLVDDGSIGNMLRLSDLTDVGLSGTLLRLIRNVGHQAAIACGLGYVAARWSGASVVIMDSDGEDRPEDIPKLLSSLDPSIISAVVAERYRRTENARFRTFYWIYKLLFRVLSGQSIQFGNFMAVSGPAVQRLASMQETWLHVAGALIASRIPRRMVPTQRGRRYFGTSTMNFTSLAVHGMRAIMVFAEVMLMRVVIACAAVAARVLVLAGVAGLLKIAGLASPGWFTSVVGLLLILVVQTIGVFAASLVLAGLTRGILRNVSNAYRDFIETIESIP
jgi:hypothetical protein